MMQYLSELSRGNVATIVSVREGHPLSERLAELGFIAGEVVRVVHEAPISRDPIVVDCGGMLLALRRTEAALVEIESNTHLQDRGVL